MDHKVIVVKPDVKVSLKLLKQDTDLALRHPYVFCVFDATLRRHSPKLRRRKTESSLTTTTKLFHSFPFVCAKENLWELHMDVCKYLQNNYSNADYRQLILGIGHFDADLECKTLKFTYHCDDRPGQIFRAITEAQLLFGH
jgi:hypothetical protein